MQPDDRDDPFDDIFREIERMMEDMVGTPGPQAGGAKTDVQTANRTHMDVYEEDDVVRVVADLPGVAREDISVQSDGEHVSVSASSEGRSYDDRITMPTPVDPESATATYNNGVLEITFERTGSPTDIDVQ